VSREPVGHFYMDLRLKGIGREGRTRLELGSARGRRLHPPRLALVVDDLPGL
jgi:hypothetical protein